jgi:hypothetical protein
MLVRNKCQLIAKKTAATTFQHIVSYFNITICMLSATTNPYSDPGSKSGKVRSLSEITLGSIGHRKSKVGSL